ncbi:hypothetical protein K503DRAFT_287942 [Rhizopogon vinicolor AM-OR11-026]|uniref:Uncharacterized protein n=1 Tax=Rhizopogon vinicolor AM-OR11-026 TaxID=1314800 RepID=A0A1B7MVK4_9AGAM|nr:hypothetical protein K503DRAFT_287942 [Rhizopogon vinicolor AM-OR11-026]
MVIVRRTCSLLFSVGVELSAPSAIVGSFPPSPDPSSAPFPPFAMPMPAISIQMPIPNVPEMPYVYGQRNASQYPFSSELSYTPEHLYTPQQPYVSEHASEHSTFSSERPYTPEPPYAPERPRTFQQPYVSEQAFDVPPHLLVSSYAKPHIDDWVPDVPGLSDEAEVGPTSEPICIYAADSVTQTQGSISRRPSLLKRVVSFLRSLGPKKWKVSHRS